ncbi:Aldo/keto reductase [Phlegmacium glaucopus]|nr:Aldo/keto reductase [Phlegmacium glaucopus]
MEEGGGDGEDGPSCKRPRELERDIRSRSCTLSSQLQTTPQSNPTKNSTASGDYAEIALVVSLLFTLDNGRGVRRCSREGCTFLDTADVYGYNEELLGKWSVFLSSQHKILPRGGYFWWVHEQARETKFSSRPSVVLKSVGKEKYDTSDSEVSADTLRRAYAVHPIAVVQQSKKICVLKACQELGVAIIPYTPFSRGMLTGIYESHDNIPGGDIRRKFPKYSKDNFPNILKLVDCIQEVAKKRGVTSGQVGKLAWLKGTISLLSPELGKSRFGFYKHLVLSPDLII